MMNMRICRRLILVGMSLGLVLAGCGKVIVYSVGDTGPAGGTVFYDKGDYINDWRYLEAASSDQATTYAWGGSGTAIGGTGTGIGSGEANTAAIVAALQDNGGTVYAAKICDELNEGGFTDWFLPSKDELAELYDQKTTVGGFSSSDYWSSSEYDSTNAWRQTFASGYQIGIYRGLDYRVRAVRAF